MPHLVRRLHVGQDALTFLRCQVRMEIQTQIQSTSTDLIIKRFLLELSKSYLDFRDKYSYH